MDKKTTGIHHITAITGDPQENLDFYTQVLGMRLVKKTVNFDSPDTYHFYFGDWSGTPGTIMTFFPIPGGRKGTIGSGQVGVTVFAVPVGTLPQWEERLRSRGVETSRTQRFGEEYLAFSDPHGLALELTERPESSSATSSGPAILGFAGAVLYSSRPEDTALLLSPLMGLEQAATEGTWTRYRSSADLGNVIDIRTDVPAAGRGGVGTVHHIAMRASGGEDQKQWQSYLTEAGYGVTPVQDRNYFTSIYFREKGGILFEIATDGPGFAVDEDPAHLGEALKLPPQYEDSRKDIESILPPVRLRKS